MDNGSPALIGEDGTVKGGMGGKFNGKNIKDAHGTEKFTSGETNKETEARNKPKAEVKKSFGSEERDQTSKALGAKEKVKRPEGFTDTQFQILKDTILSWNKNPNSQEKYRDQLEYKSSDTGESGAVAREALKILGVGKAPTEPVTVKLAESHGDHKIPDAPNNPKAGQAIGRDVAAPQPKESKTTSVEANQFVEAHKDSFVKIKGSSDLYVKSGDGMAMWPVHKDDQKNGVLTKPKDDVLRQIYSKFVEPSQEPKAEPAVTVSKSEKKNVTGTVKPVDNGAKPPYNAPLDNKTSEGSKMENVNESAKDRKDYLDQQKKLVSVGKLRDYQYMEQCSIAQIQGFITRDELRERFNSIPFNPLY